MVSLTLIREQLTFIWLLQGMMVDLPDAGCELKYECFAINILKNALRNCPFKNALQGLR